MRGDQNSWPYHIRTKKVNMSSVSARVWWDVWQRPLNERTQRLFCVCESNNYAHVL